MRYKLKSTRSNETQQNIILITLVQALVRVSHRIEFLCVFFSLYFDTVGRMEFMSKSLQFLFLFVSILFSCAHLNHDSKLGNCSENELKRSPLLLRTFIRQPYTGLDKSIQYDSHKWFGTIRIPEVLIVSFCVCG